MSIRTSHSISIERKVSVKLQDLKRLDIIEEVTGPTPWVSSVIVVPKANNNIRLCVDMRQAAKLFCDKDTLYLQLRRNYRI